jgi:eukaryotic-like serine/threonine-protein kinase
MFFNEAQAAGALDHPNILRVYDAGEANGEPYIVMEYVAGGETLKSFCTPQRLLPMERVVHLIHQCAKALDYAHRRGVLHRDIKPANIMLTEEGEAKIGDFGIAERLHADKTQFMGSFGSPRYMSPEQARDEPVTGQSDLYSLGVTLYELMAGRPPFEARGLAALVVAITTREPPSLRSIRPEVPESLEAVVRRAMEPSLDRRYRTGAEFAADLAKAFDELSRPPAEPDEATKFARARALPFFNEFSDAELEEVLSAAHWEHHPAGSVLIAEGTTEESFSVLLAGEVTVRIGEHAVGTLGAGECVGEMGYIARARRSASVVVEEDVTALRIDGALMDWASIPVQMRFHKVFQRTLIERLARTSLELARLRAD